MLNDVCLKLNLYLIETPFNTFANRADSDQAAHDNSESDITLSCCGSQSFTMEFYKGIIEK